MNVPYNIKVPVEVALALRARETALKTALMKDLEATPKSDANKRRALYDKIKHATIQNLLRVSLLAGLPAVEKMSDADLVNRMVDGGVVKGRPRRAA
jgi:hypothetical protein